MRKRRIAIFGTLFLFSVLVSGIAFAQRTLVFENFENFNGTNSDGAGFANVGETQGTAIPGVSGVVAGAGISGLTIGQFFVEIADFDISSTAKVFQGKSADLNRNGLSWDFTVANTTELLFCVDFGVATSGNRGVSWQVNDSLGDVIFSGVSPEQIGFGAQGFSTQFRLDAGSYKLLLGGTTSSGNTGVHVDNIQLSSVQKPGDVNFDGVVNFSDIPSFIEILQSQ